MAAGDRITEDWQFEYNGYLMGGDDMPSSIVKIDGLQDMPSVESADLKLLRRHGMFPGDDFMGPRTIGLELELFGTDAAALTTELTYLTNATTPGIAEIPLCFQIPGVAGGGRRQVMARPRKRAIPIGLDYYYRMPIAQIEWLATDPYIYDQALSTASIGLPSGGTGITFPIGFVAPALTFGSGGGPTVMSCVNNGTAPASPTLVVTGPVLNPSILSNTGDVLKANVSLPSGMSITFDTAKRTVTVGGVNYYSTLTGDSRWFQFNPGTNTLAFTSDSATTSTLSAEWRSAWL